MFLLVFLFSYTISGGKSHFENLHIKVDHNQLICDEVPFVFVSQLFEIFFCVKISLLRA